MSRNSHLLLSLPGAVLATVALLSTMPLAAQAASYTYIDQKAPYSNANPPMLTALNLPKVGTTFKVQVPTPWSWCWAHGPCQEWDYFLALGTKNPNILIPSLGGFLFTSADVVVPVRWTSQPQQMSFPIPNSSQLVGVRFYQQVLARYGFGANTSYPTSYTLTLSRGGVGVIGK